MFAGVVIGTFIVAIFLAQLVAMWWRQNAWRRRWKDRENETD